MALTGGAFLSQTLGCSPAHQEPLSNWAGNLQYHTSDVSYPSLIEQVQDIVRKSDKIKALGSRHSFNTIADSTHKQVSLKSLNKVVSLDKTTHQVTVEGGIKYGELAPYLHQNGYALHNLASLPHISIAGASVTATHGSGINNGNLSTQIAALEFVNAAGDLVTLSKKKDADQFEGAVVNLGAIGVITKLTLDLLPTFNMKQVVYQNLPMQELEKNFMSIFSSGYSVSLFTDWKNRNINEVWIKSIADKNSSANIPPELFGAKLATRNLHPIEEMSAENVTDQMGIAGPWYERLPHFKMGFTPSAGKELQSEFFVPLEHAYEAIMAMEKLHEKISPHLFISEIRVIKADNFWMSPCYKKDCVALHTTWKQEIETVNNLISLVEEQLAPFNPRPHWAKLFNMAPSVLQSRIERLADFKELVKTYDPKGKFSNEFLERNLSMKI
jgi:xylitol oxidase